MINLYTLAAVILGYLLYTRIIKPMLRPRPEDQNSEPIVSRKKKEDLYGGDYVDYEEIEEK